MTSKKNKEQVNITLSPYLKKELDSVVGDKTQFSSTSDVCTIAITQFLERLRAEKGLYAQTLSLTENFDVFTSGVNIERDMVSGLSGRG